MIEVWHMKHDLIRDQRLSVQGYGDGDQIAAVNELWTAGGYEKVAEVDTDSLEVVWRLTNNVDTSWSMEPHRAVKVISPVHVIDGQTYGRKSSETGDVFIRKGEVAEYFVVAPVGMTAWSPEKAHAV